MSDWDSEESCSKSHHRKHKRRESGLDLFRECKKKHKSHKRKINDRHCDHKRRKLKDESRDCLRQKSEPKSRHEKKFARTESKEKDIRLNPSGRPLRQGCPTEVNFRVPDNSVEDHDDEEFYAATEQDCKSLPDDLKIELEELYLLGVDKDKLFNYMCNVTKKKLDKRNLLRIFDSAVKHERDISKDRALVLIKKVYGFETKEEAEEILQQLLMEKPSKRPRKEESRESSENVTVDFAKEGKKKPKVEHHGDSSSWGESTKSGKTSKGSTNVEKPNFSLSGKLAEETNIFNGVVVKYSEPPEARMPKKRWRLYPFKGDQGLPTLYIHRQSAYLLGRDRKVADIPIDHPSCSKQHAALQYRLVTYQRSDGTIGKQIRLYLIDLESANGTYINNNKIEPRKYVELFEKDVIKFGFSSREYVLLHEHSKDDDESENEA